MDDRSGSTPKRHAYLSVRAKTVRSNADGVRIRVLQSVRALPGEDPFPGLCRPVAIYARHPLSILQGIKGKRRPSNPLSGYRLSHDSSLERCGVELVFVSWLSSCSFQCSPVYTRGQIVLQTSGRFFFIGETGTS